MIDEHAIGLKLLAPEIKTETTKLRSLWEHYSSLDDAERDTGAGDADIVALARQLPDEPPAIART